MEMTTDSYLPDSANVSTGYFVKLFSDRDRDVYMMVNYYVLTSTISVFGVVANIINIIVFYKQGFDNTINISFLALAISDLCSLMPLFWANIFMSGFLVTMGFHMAPLEVAYLTGGHPHICFVRITSWITVYITAERCLCITLPLKIKQMITARRTTAIICAIYVLIMSTFLPEFLTAYIGWRVDPGSNQTILGLVFTSYRQNVEGVTFILYSILGFASFIIVIMLTLVLVVQLQRKSKWRRMANMDNSRSELMSRRESNTVTIVVMIATVLIICYSPGVVVSSVSFIETEFSVGGHYVNAFFTLWSFVFVFEALNSSVNIFLYYNMSSKYRETFRCLMCLSWLT